MTREFFTAQTLEDLKKEYHKLAKQYHPDCGGDNETMKRINAEYDRLAEILAGREAKGETEQERANNARKAWDAARGMREAIAAIVRLAGICIEICGTWIWVSGLTYQYRDVLKSAGFNWASGKKKWYWKPEEWQRKYRAKPLPMDVIRARYGSILVELEEQPELTA